MSAHVIEQLSAYLDDELVPGERAALETHLRECSECAKRLEELVAVDELARGLAAEAPEGYFTDFAARVRGRIEPNPARKPAPFRLPMWVLAAAAAVALGVMVPALVRRGSYEQRLPAPVELQDRVADAPAAPPPAAAPSVTSPVDASQAASATLGERKVPTQPGASRDEKPAKNASRQKEYAEPHGVDGGVAARLDSTAELKEEAVSPEQEQERREVDEKLRALGYVAPDNLQKKDEATAASTSQNGYAAAPPAAAKAQEADAPKRALEVRGKDKQAALSNDSRFRELLDRSATTLGEARSLREAWRVHATLATGAEADEARVRVVEVGAQAYRIGRDAADLSLLEKDADAYLARLDALQAARVRAALTAARAPRP